MDDENENSYPTSKRGFHLSHLNLQSINNKIDLVKIQIKQLKFHLFTFSESWLTEDIPDYMLNIEGYNLVRLDREWKEGGSNATKRGGGVGLYIKDDLTYTQANMVKHNISNKDIECCWIMVIRENTKEMLVCVVYRPPSGNVEAFCDYLNLTLEEIGNNFNREIFIMGDFNINYLGVNTQNMKHLLNFEQTTGLKQIIKQPTRGENCIDLIFTNSNDVTNSGVWGLNISDHDMVYITKKKASVTRKRVSFIGRSYRNYNKEVLQGRLNNLDWNQFWRMQDPNECWSYILNGIENELSIMCPLKTRVIRSSNEPWMNNGILEAIFDKDQAWRRAKKTGNMDDINRAKRLRNDVKDMIRNAKRNFIRDELENDVGSSKRFWEKINHILPARESGNTIRLIDQTSEQPVEDNMLPSYINSFFTDIGPNLANKFRDDWVDDLTVYEGEEIGDIHIDEQYMEKLVKDINVHKASSVVNVSAYVLKDAFLVLIPQLTFMYNKSFETGIFPYKWKIANVIPLKKGGDPTDVNNLRPVSLLPLPGKMAERIVHTHISEHVERLGLLNNRQGGFRKGKSTISTVAMLTDDILQGLNSKEYSIATFIDLKKAFDTINHEILLRKLPHFGLNNNVRNWVANYLSNRVQKCSVNGLTSEERAITCGVPQGSILGPLLFLLYINDIDIKLINSKVLLYADDTVIYANHKDETHAHLWVSEDLIALCEWCNKNQLTINQKKTKLMLFGTKNMLKQGKKPDTFIDDTKLHYVNQFNYLGIKLDSTLTFESHANETVRMVAHKLFIFSKIRKYITVQQAITIYRSKIVPYFDYGDIFLINISQKSIDKLQRLQNRALRICLAQDGRSNVNQLHNTCNINKLEYRRRAHLLNFVYKRAQSFEYVNEGRRELRRFDAPVLMETRANNKSFERSILYQGAKLWNDQLPADRSIATHKEFKR